MTDKDKLKQLFEKAEKMYQEALNLTTDTKGLHDAMREYHQWIVKYYFNEDDERLIIPNRLYVIKVSYADYVQGDYFRGLNDNVVQHIRSGNKMIVDDSTKDMFFDSEQEYNHETMANLDVALQTFMQNVQIREKENIV